MGPLKGEAIVVSGTATTTVTRYYVKNARDKETFAHQITFHNTDTGGNKLHVFLNGGTSFMTIGNSEIVVVNGVTNVFSVQSSSGTASWFAVCSVAS